MCFTLADEIFFAQGQKSNLNVCSPEMKKTLKCRSMLYSVVNQVAELCNWHKVNKEKKKKWQPKFFWGFRNAGL